MRRILSYVAGCGLAGMILHAAEVGGLTNAPGWLTQPISLAESLDIALRQNSAILKSEKDLAAAHGIAVQTRAIVLPKLRLSGTYQATDQLEQFPFPGRPPIADQTWAANIRVVQSVYEGGRMRSSLRQARLLREQALLQHNAVVADTVLAVRSAYDDVLLAAEQIGVQEASVRLLEKELENTRNRFEAGGVPRFNVLRAEVELANAQPRLIRARNAYRIAKNNLADLLGYNLPRDIGEDIPLRLSDTLTAEPFEIQLPAAVAQAVERRPELSALRLAARLREEAITSAKGTYRPRAEIFAGYGSRNANFTTDLTEDVSGWMAGAQVTWDLFDGFITKGRVMEARALHERALAELDDIGRRIELEVRTAYSSFIEAREVLESTKKVQEQADEALRMAVSRNEAGSGIQLDVLNAQTALTEARLTRVQAMHDFSVARARLERAMGWLTPAGQEQP